MSDKKAKTSRDDILGLIPEYFRASFPKKEFVRGQDPVPVSGKVFDAEDLKYLVDASLDFWLTSGRYADEFEKTFAEYAGVEYACLVNSGSSANLLALACLTSASLGDRALMPGDEVITVAAAFPTTVNPIYQYGLTPVYVDVELGTYNASFESIAAAFSPKTKAIFIAHTLGNPFEADKISDFAREKGIWLIEDCCDALGSELNGKKTGTFGDIATFSFYPAHHITMGEGGAVVTNSGRLALLARSFRDWGRDCRCAPGQDNRCGKRFSLKFGDLPMGYDHKYVYSEIGYNLKLTDMQAAVGVSQLKKVDGFVRKRRENFDFLKNRLSGMEDKLELPKPASNSNPSWFGFPIGVKPGARGLREELTRFLDSRKIGTRLLFGGNLTRQPAYTAKNHRISGSLINTDYVMENVFWIGLYPGLTEEMLEYSAESVAGFFR